MRRHWSVRGVRKLRAKWNRNKIRGNTVLAGPGTGSDALKLLDSFMRVPDRVINSAETVKNSRHTLCLDVRWKGTRYFLKAYRSSGPAKSISYMLRPRKALRIWNISWNISARRLPVMLPLAVIQAPGPWGRFYGALLYPWQESLAREEWKEEVADLSASGKNHRSFVKNLARSIWNIHQRGIYHGDCKITNFVVDSNGGIDLFFDVDSTRIEKKVSGRQRRADIVCMAASLVKIAGQKTDGLDMAVSFFSAYAFLHFPWRHERDMYITRLVERLHQKLQKSSRRKPHFNTTA